MKEIVIHNEQIMKADRDRLIQICPFHALEEKDDQIQINGACRLCGICTRQYPPEIIEMVEKEDEFLNRKEWRGIAVFIDCTEGRVHPVSLELLGKARSLADQIHHPVYGVMIGEDLMEIAQSLQSYQIDEIFLYDHGDYRYFTPEPYAEAFSHFIKTVKPSSVLIGGTKAGRSLAPRIAARFRTGLTADCTRLEVRENSDLVQIRPAFGGNIMAQIVTKKNRPQLCTVRYKIFDQPAPSLGWQAKITQMQANHVVSRVQILKQEGKPKQADISDAERILALGRGLQNQKDLTLFENFAEAIGAKIASTRPLAEAGWIEPYCQIGLSGRTVKPKLIICAGISGSVQFSAGMESAQYIVAVNRDKNAPIFRMAHLGLVGDMYELLPRMADKIRAAKKEGRLI